MNKRTVKKAMGMLTCLSTVAAFVGLGYHANASEIKPDMDSHKFYDYTNTYQYKYTSTTGMDFNYESRYLLGSKTDAKVEAGDTKITVFTHGWCGDITNWYGYEGQIENTTSVVRDLYNKKGGKVYVGAFTVNEDQYDKIRNNDEKSLKYDFAFYDVTDDYKEDGYVALDTLKNHKTATLENKNENAIVLFNGACSGNGHDMIYTQFNYMMSNIMYSYRKKNGVLPTVNLVGHSRGGLTNMMYAIDHPDVVSSLTSFGTPYLGTHLAEIDLKYCNNQAYEAFDAIQDKLDESRNPTMWAYKGCKDLANKNAYLTLYKNWNTNYSKYYKHIDATAIGSATPITYLVDFLASKVSLPNWAITSLKTIVNYVASAASFAAKFNMDFRKVVNMNKLRNMIESFLNNTGIVQSITSKIDPTLYAQFTFLTHLDSILIGGIDTVLDALKFDTKTKTLVLMSDGAVDLDSQMAEKKIDGIKLTYKGFTRTSAYIDCGTTFTVDTVPHCKTFFQPNLKSSALSVLL